MTAEIAVLNRQAIALAADSAVTIGGGGGPKVFNSVHKLFALSKHEPVGVMIYGNAELSGTPWETIVKVYRRHLGSTRKATLEEYAADFLSFLDRDGSLFPEQQQKHEYFRHAMGCYHGIAAEIEAEMKLVLRDQGNIRSGQVRAICTKTIREKLQEYEAVPFLPGRSSRSVQALTRRYDTELDTAIDLTFEKLPVGQVARGRLKKIVSTFFCRQLFPNVMSGVVVAGFGEDEHFPCLRAFDVQSVVGDRLKYNAADTVEISGDSNAAVVPFAQKEMVQLFIEGLDPGLGRQFVDNLTSFLKDLPSAIIDQLGHSESEKKKILKALLPAMDRSAEIFVERLASLSQERHITPVVSTVAVLPKEELAAMAEALVNLTSFKRRVTMDAETVGGPIDVAVITKGDGFIWIRRKHYFDPALNHQFFNNYNS